MLVADDGLGDRPVGVFPHRNRDPSEQLSTVALLDRLSDARLRP